MKDTTTTTTFVGLDVHKETIAVAVARVGQEPESLGTISNTPDAMAKLMRRLGPAKNLRVCYEAGPCGYAIFRQLQRMSVECVVIAPSLVPQRAGDRVKTDRRDALKLARLHRSGELVSVWVPDEAQEALRDLVRAREDTIEDRLRKRHQLSKFLLRLEVRPPEKVRAWSAKHKVWVQGLKFEQPAQQIVLREYIQALHETEMRLQRLEIELAELAQNCPHAAVIAALQSLRGIGMLTAVTLVAELGDLSRFATAQQLMAYTGLVPSEHSSGGSRHRGGITKCGNAHVRRVIIEAGWHYRRLPRVGAGLRDRQTGVPPVINSMTWKAQHRLNLKYRRLVGRGKPKQVAVVAVARELLGFVWAVAREVAQLGIQAA